MTRRPSSAERSTDLNVAYCYDGNGNVTQVVDWAHDPNDPSGALVAKYEYDPYGNVIAQAGPHAGDNPFRFSTKFFDDETGLGYWGFRYYSPSLGRWISRDPHSGDGANEYSYLRNEPIASSDKLGLWRMGPPGGSRRLVMSEVGDTVNDLGSNLKLDPDHFRLWLRSAPHGLPHEASSVFGCAGCQYSVPNVVVLVYGALNSDEAWWYPLSIFNIFASNMNRGALSALRAGNKLLYLDEPTAERVKRSLEDINLYGFMFAGHTDSAGALIVRKPYPAQPAVQEDNYRELAGGRHKLAFMYLWGCGTAQNSWDAINLGLVGKVDVWLSNVSRLGTFRGVLGEPDFWTYGGDWMAPGIPGNRER